MQLDYTILIDVLLWATIFFIVYYFVYRKYIYSIFDPIFTYVYVTAFSSVFVLYVIQDTRFIFHYFICHIFLFIGFFSAGKLNLSNAENSTYNFYNRDLLEITVYILLVVYICANIFTLYSRGSAFFSDDPYARETNFEEGFGIFRRINWGIGSFTTAGLTILYLTKPKRIFLLLILIIAFFTMLEGTKSSLLRIVIIVSALIYHPYFIDNKIVVQSIKKYIPIGALAVATAFIIVLAKESGSNSDVFLSFIKRLLSGADAVLYFYLPQNEYLRTIYHPLDFIPYVLNPILGFLHIVPYVEPFGSVTVSNTQVSSLKTDVYLAPNTPFYIEGQIFFGYYGAFVYSFFIGSIISLVRQLFFLLSAGSYFALVLACTVFFHSLPIVNETSLFITACLNTFIFVIPTYVVICFLMNKKIVFRWLKFSGSRKRTTNNL